VKNAKIVIADFGLCRYVDTELENMQTRYYRAPEVILEMKYCQKSDIWSVGCLIYELITGKILFDPYKSHNFDRERHHMYLIQKSLGPIPKKLTEQSRLYSTFYKKNGYIRGKNDLSYDSLILRLYEHMKDKDTEDNVAKMITLIMNMLKYDPEERPTAEECMSQLI
jgi:serine/threonine-protein kinase SRPK3